MDITKNKIADLPNTLTTNKSSKKSFFQPKLTINQPNDIYEQEADTMADHVMRMSDSSMSSTFFKSAGNGIQRKCQECEEEDKHIHRKENSGGEVQGSNRLDSYINSLGSSGQPLPEASRKFFEPRFRHDFSNVRIHNDMVAAKSAQSINALAYTTGNNIVFNNGQYSPDSESGKKLMAHELTHVVQQRSDAIAPKIQRHKDDLVAYSGGQRGFIWVIQAGNLIFSAPAVSGHPGRGENEPSAGPIPTGKYMLHPKITAQTVTTLQHPGVCGAAGINTGFQEITSNDASPCSLAHYCNVPCPTKDHPDQKCFTPVDCWGPKRIKIEGSANVTTPAGKNVVRDGFFIHGGNPADAVSSGCVKSLDVSVFDQIKNLSGINGAVPFCVGTACPAILKNALIGAVVTPVNNLVNSVINQVSNLL
ncbi:MAG: hypothetical protein JWP37_352 [Mucilaginibacter sp.]|nr:hypothetical protein [Mucilaginibacter sp.]